MSVIELMFVRVSSRGTTYHVLQWLPASQSDMHILCWAVPAAALCMLLLLLLLRPRWGFCGWSFLNSHHELLVVEDMDVDARFSANFFVCDPAFNLKFYVAAPLISSNGHRLGTL